MNARSARATLVGIGAVLLWALLALFTAASGDVPPLQLTAMSFLVAFLIALTLWIVKRRNPLRRLRQPPAAWLLGVAGLFGYHAMYFLALRTAPVVDASLIAYLWPLLIVLFSALLPGERLRWFHLAGAVLGFAGAILIISRGGLAFAGLSGGYFAAMACALIWSGYSVLNRRFPDVPTDAVGGFCGVTAILAFGLHLGLEQTVWPGTAWQWLAVLGLGLGPVGGAFFLWDHGTKHGDIRVLGASAYLAPLISTVILIAAREAEPTWRIGLACLLITGGAALAAREMLRRRRPA
ncbi:DMT family transporter [Minwuia thermotolerans]|uniref:EamA family transporter n=1 Tax=Minwuia thermotolerans TaxID=2056226 RepID=A0A2M9G187_9PROT|nr:DMT family transporter [Minwuia thermotolerans]PJK29487.1 EamA family transporter [Minwuia thermotolerans]